MNTVYNVKVCLDSNNNAKYHIKYNDNTVWIISIHTLTDVSKVMTLIKDTMTLTVTGPVKDITFDTLVKKTSFTSLKTLHLEDVNCDFNYTLSDVMKSISTVEYITLKNCTFRLGSRLKSSTLKSLHIDKCCIADVNMVSSSIVEDAYPNLNGLSSIEYLFIKSVSNIHIPKIDKCRYLEYLYIANLSSELNNALDDHDWSSMKHLEYLTLKNINVSNTSKKNALHWIGQLSRLKDVAISKCRMNDVTLPHSICSLTNLEHLVISKNRLSGTIPSDIGVLSKLSTLDLSGNRLTGSIPSSICTLPLHALKLSNNKLTGTIPSDIGRLTSVYSLKLHTNKIKGTIPDDIGKLSNLYTLKLSDNKLSGDVPNSLYALPNLQDIYLFGNPLNTIVLSDDTSETTLSVHMDPSRVKIEGDRWSVSEWSPDEFIRDTCI